jgi:hypothetical protein
MCLPVSRLFWVSSLAYPNLLGTKGYVVVVVEQIINQILLTKVTETWGVGSVKIMSFDLDLAIETDLSSMN